MVQFFMPHSVEYSNGIRIKSALGLSAAPQHSTGVARSISDTAESVVQFISSSSSSRSSVIIHYNNVVVIVVGRLSTLWT